LKYSQVLEVFSNFCCIVLKLCFCDDSFALRTFSYTNTFFCVVCLQHVVSVWSNPEALAAAGNNAEYSEAMATVAKHFAGPPQVRDLEVLAEFGPKTS